MPAVKKAGSARRAPASKNATPTLNKDGSERKRPGPAKGSARGPKTVAVAASATTVDTGTTKPKVRKVSRKQKTFLLYAVEGNELSFAVEHPGATGQIAVASAVKAGILAPDTPYVFLTPATVARAVEIEPIERPVQYKVKVATKKRTPRKPKEVAVEPVAEIVAEPSTDAATTDPVAKPASARGGKKAAPAPGTAAAVTAANPFAS